MATSLHLLTVASFQTFRVHTSAEVPLQPHSQRIEVVVEASPVYEGLALGDKIELRLMGELPGAGLTCAFLSYAPVPAHLAGVVEVGNVRRSPLFRAPGPVRPAGSSLDNLLEQMSHAPLPALERFNQDLALVQELLAKHLATKPTAAL